VQNFGQVIFEVLDQTEKSDAEALPYLFNDLAEVNQSQETSIDRCEAVTDSNIIGKFDTILGTTNNVHISVLQGKQKVAPNKRPGEPV